MPSAATCRATRSAATITRCCAARLAQLAEKIRAHSASRSHRVFVDSGPVLEKALARNAGLGWIGKHTNLHHADAGSWFFLGEILTDLPLPVDEPASDHCGTCRACIDVCPTGAIVAPYELDATRCISYLTIELRSAIPDRVPQGASAIASTAATTASWCARGTSSRACAASAISRRATGWTTRRLVELFAWSEAEFLARTEGSAIRRIGYECWLRNIAVALGNAPTTR